MLRKALPVTMRREMEEAQGRKEREHIEGILAFGLLWFCF